MESTNVSNDRLRKAIERNRAKQSKRDGGGSTAPASGWSSRRTAPPRPTVKAASPTRRTVARADDVEFTTSLRAAPRKAPATVGYATSRAAVKTSPVKRKSSKRKAKIAKGQTYLLKFGWVFAGILLVRLVFSSGGVIDFYDRKEFVQDKKDELVSLKVENEELVIEIDRIQNSSRFQRKLVRDHLGYIARDEYLILFQREAPSPTISATSRL